MILTQQIWNATFLRGINLLQCLNNRKPPTDLGIRTYNRSMVARKDCKAGNIIILVFNYHTTRHEGKSPRILNQESESRTSLTSVTTYDIHIIFLPQFPQVQIKIISPTENNHTTLSESI